MPKLGPMGREMTMVSLCLDDRYRTLQRLRDRLGEQLDVTESARDVCALARRLEAVLKELDDMPQSGPVSKADEIAARRAARRAAQRG